MKEYKGPWPMREGREAGLHGKPVTDNPYPKEHRYHGRWFEGYADGRSKAEAEHIRIEKEQDAELWGAVKEALETRGNVFSPEQLQALHDMLDELQYTLTR